MLKILVLSDFDSRIKWGVAAALKMTNAEQVTLIMHRSQKDKVLSYTKKIQNFLYCDPLMYLNKFSVTDYDVVIFAIGGWLNVKAVSLIQKNNPLGVKRPLLVGGLNGLVDCSDPDVVFSRSGLDLLLLNSRNDYEFFEQTFNSQGIKSPILLETGYLRNYKNINSNNQRGENVLFVQQDGLPASRKAFVYLITKLVEFAATNQNSKVYIKLRNSGSVGVNSTIVNYNAAKITKKVLSERSDIQNIELSNVDLESLFRDCDEVWSISSTMLIEALMQDKKAFCIADFGISKKNGNVPFLNSGILVFLDDLSVRVANVNEHWRSKNISLVIDDHLLRDFVIDCIKKLSNQEFKFNKQFYKNSPWLNDFRSPGLASFIKNFLN